MKPPKAVRAWAIVSRRGVLAPFAVYRRRVALAERLDEKETVIRVLLVPDSLGTCSRCGEKACRFKASGMCDRCDAVLAAERAVLDAAERQERAFEGDASYGEYVDTCRVTEEKVRALRKVRDGR